MEKIHISEQLIKSDLLRIAELGPHGISYVRKWSSDPGSVSESANIIFTSIAMQIVKDRESDIAERIQSHARER